MKMRRPADSGEPPNSLLYSQSEHPFGGRFDVAIEQRYRGILDASRDVFARRGFHQAPIREIAHAADLSLAGLYHYVKGKEELLFLVLDRALDTLLAALDQALAAARSPEGRLLALIRTHLEFGFRHAADLKLINRDYELLAEPRRSEIAAKRTTYLRRGLAVLRELDPHARSGDELLSATNLLLGMLNGIATRPFLRSGDAPVRLASEVGALFLYGFLERSHPADPLPASSGGDEHGE
jgi:TetR/AcrR family transcriptional regulator, cholesterol catabolism regulator